MILSWSENIQIQTRFFFCVMFGWCSGVTPNMSPLKEIVNRIHWQILLCASGWEREREEDCSHLFFECPFLKQFRLVGVSVIECYLRRGIVDLTKA